MTNENENIIEEVKKISQTIVCKYIHEHEVFVSSDQRLWPCCFLWDSWFYNKDNIREKLSKYEENWNSLKHHTVEEILNHEWYKKELGDSWDPTHDMHLKRCIRTCALNKAYQNKLNFTNE